MTLNSCIYSKWTVVNDISSPLSQLGDWRQMVTNFYTTFHLWNIPNILVRTTLKYSITVTLNEAGKHGFNKRKITTIRRSFQRYITSQKNIFGENNSTKPKKFNDWPNPLKGHHLLLYKYLQRFALVLLLHIRTNNALFRLLIVGWLLHSPKRWLTLLACPANSRHFTDVIWIKNNKNVAIPSLCGCSPQIATAVRLFSWLWDLRSSTL